MRLALAFLLVLARVASAEEPPANPDMNAPATGQIEPAPPQPQEQGDQPIDRALIDPDQEVSRRRYDEGIALYEKGEYAKAITVFEDANRARPSQALVYDIARCYDRMGDWHQALIAYKKFWAMATEAERPVDVQQRIATLEARIVEERAPVERARRKRWRIAAISVGAVAVASFVVGGAMYGWAKSGLSSRHTYCEDLPRNCVPAEWSDLSARANVAYALFAIGGVAAAVDVGLWTVSLLDKERPRAWLSPTSSGVGLGASF